MGSIIGSALLFGWIINTFLPREWFVQVLEHAQHGGHLIPVWLKYVSAGVLALLLLNALFRRYFVKSKSKENQQINKEDTMETIRVKIDGMTCNHCKMTVEKHLKSLKGIENVQVDLTTGTAEITGGSIDIQSVADTVNDLGYTYVDKI
jgi:copper chaperone CopZ